jgi:symplekin
VSKIAKIEDKERLTGYSDPILIDATMNCMAVLIRSRPAVANKIITAILNFNPLKQANSPMTPRLRVIVKSMEKTTRALLKNINKNNPGGPLASKIDAYLIRLNQSHSSIFAEAHSLKRPAPSEPTDRLDDAKRIRLTGVAPRKYPHMPPPPNSFAQLFTLTEDKGLTSFDVKVLPVDMINTITSLTLKHVDQNALDEAIAVIRARYAHLQKMQQPTPIPEVPMAGPTGIDDEDDYDPEYDSGGETVLSPVATAQALQELMQPDIALGPFELPKPPPLTEDDVKVLSRQTSDRFMDIIEALSMQPQATSKQKLGLNRLAASANDRDAWVTLVARLATRAPSRLDSLVRSDDRTSDEDERVVKPESTAPTNQASLANDIRDGLFAHIAQDFKSRLNVAISWLNEEWYNDKLNTTYPKDSHSSNSLPNYYPQLLRILDYMVTFLDARDNKLLIRFLSEIPAINPDVLERVKMLAMDPERVNMCLMSMQYLILMRPPVRGLALDTIEQMWRDERFKEAKAQAEKVLRKWRPAVLERLQDTKQEQEPGVVGMTINGLNAPPVPVKVESLDPRKRGGTNTPIAAGS